MGESPLAGTGFGSLSHYTVLTSGLFISKRFRCVSQNFQNVELHFHKDMKSCTIECLRGGRGKVEEARPRVGSCDSRFDPLHVSYREGWHCRMKRQPANLCLCSVRFPLSGPSRGGSGKASWPALRIGLLRTSPSDGQCPALPSADCRQRILRLTIKEPHSNPFAISSPNLVELTEACLQVVDNISPSDDTKHVEARGLVELADCLMTDPGLSGSPKSRVRSAIRSAYASARPAISVSYTEWLPL